MKLSALPSCKVDLDLTPHILEPSAASLPPADSLLSNTLEQAEMCLDFFQSFHPNGS